MFQFSNLHQGTGTSIVLTKILLKARETQTQEEAEEDVKDEPMSQNLLGKMQIIQYNLLFQIRIRNHLSGYSGSGFGSGFVSGTGYGAKPKVNLKKMNFKGSKNF